MLKLRLVPVVHNKEIRGEVGVLKLEQVSVVCPACGQQVEAVATGGRVKGYCTVAKQFVNFLIETQLAKRNFRQAPEYRAKLSTATKKLWQDPGYQAKQISTRSNPVTAETRAKISASTKKLWQDPKYRARQIATLTGKHPSPETKAKISAALTRWHRKGRRSLVS